MAKISVKIKANAKQNSISIEESGFYKISVKALPIEGKANNEIINYLSTILHLPKNKIEILKGNTSKYKTISIELDDIELQEKLNNFIQ